MEKGKYNAEKSFSLALSLLSPLFDQSYCIASEIRPPNKRVKTSTCSSNFWHSIFDPPHDSLLVWYTHEWRSWSADCAEAKLISLTLFQLENAFSAFATSWLTSKLSCNALFWQHRIHLMTGFRNYELTPSGRKKGVSWVIPVRKPDFRKRLSYTHSSSFGPFSCL